MRSTSFFILIGRAQRPSPTKPPLCKGRGTACGGGIVYLMIFALQKSTSIPNCVVTKYALLHFAIRKISPAPLFLLFPTQRTSFCLVSGALLSAFRIAIPAPYVLIAFFLFANFEDTYHHIGKYKITNTHFVTIKYRISV